MLAGAVNFKLLADIMDLQAKMQQAERLVGGAVGKIKEQFGGMLATLGAGISVAGLLTFIKTTVDGVDALNDLKDATGSTIEKISALEDVALRSGTSFDTVSTAMLKFNGILNNAKPGSDAELALKALNLDVKELKAMDPADAMLKTAIAMSKFADDGNKARLMQELFGKSTKDVAAFLKDLAEKGQLVATVTTEQADEAEKFNKQLADIGKNATDASRVLVGPMVTAINQVITKFKEGRAAGKGFFESLTKNYWDNVRDLYGMAQPNTGGASGSWEAPEPPKPSIGTVRSASDIAAAAAASKKALADQNKELSEQTKLLAELTGLNGSFAEDWDRLTTIYKAGKLSLDGLTKAQADLLAKQPAIKDAAKLLADGEAERVKTLQALHAEQIKQVDTYEKTVAGLFDQNKALKDEIEIMGLSAKGQLELTQARNNALIVTKQQELASIQAGNAESGFMSRREIALAEEIRLLQERNVLMGDKSVLQESMNSFREVWASVDRTAHDVFVNIFEGGQDAFTKLRNVLKATLLDLLYQMTVKKWIFNISASVTGTASSIASAATGQGGGGMLSNLSSANSLYSLASTGYAATLGAGVSSVLGATAGNAAIATAITGSASSATAAALAASQAAGTATAASATLASVGSSIAAAVPYIAAALAAVAVVNSLLSKKDSRFGGTYADNFTGAGAQYIHGPVQGSTGDQAVRDAINATAAGINGLLKTVGSAASLIGYQAALETSNKGRGGVLAGGTLSTGATFGEDAVGSNYDGTYYETTSTNSPDSATANANFALDLKQSIVQALQAAGDVPASIKKLVAGIDAEALSDADVTTLLNAINTTVLGVEQFRAALGNIGLSQFADIAFDAASAIAAASGGFEPLVANLAAYYDTYSTESEKAANTTRQITEALAAVNVAMPATRAEFKSQVEANLALGEAGAPAVAALLSVNQAFASVTPAIESVASSISDAMKRLMDDRAGLEIELMRKQGNKAGADAAQYAIDTAGLDSAARAMHDYNATLRLQIAALDAATVAAEAIASERSGLQQQYDQLAMTSAELLAQQRAGLDESNRALFDSIQAIQAKTAADQAAAQAQAAIASERAGLQQQYDQLTMTSAELLAQQRVGLDESNRALFDSIQAIQAKTAADQAAAQAMASFMSAALAGAQQMADAKQAQKADLQGQLDALTLSGPALADKQFVALSRVNEVLFDQVQAATAVSDAQKDLIAVSQDAASSFGTLGDSLRDFRAGVLASAAGVNGSQAATALAAGNFRSVSSRAGLGDKDAMGQLAGAGQGYLTAAAASASTALDYQRALLTVLSGTDSAISVADRQVSLAEQQLGALVGIKEVLTLAQAQAALASAQGAQGAVNANAPFAIAMAKAADAYASARNTLLLQSIGHWQQGYDDPAYAKTAAAEMAAKEAALKATYEATVAGINAARSQAASVPVPASYRAPAAAQGSSPDVVAVLNLLRAELAAANRTIALNTLRSARMAGKWDIDGQPSVRQPIVKAA